MNWLLEEARQGGRESLGGLVLEMPLWILLEATRRRAENLMCFPLPGQQKLRSLETETAAVREQFEETCTNGEQPPKAMGLVSGQM